MIGHGYKSVTGFTSFFGGLFMARSFFADYPELIDETFIELIDFVDALKPSLTSKLVDLMLLRKSVGDNPPSEFDLTLLSEDIEFGKCSPEQALSSPLMTAFSPISYMQEAKIAVLDSILHSYPEKAGDVVAFVLARATEWGRDYRAKALDIYLLAETAKGSPETAEATTMPVEDLAMELVLAANKNALPPTPDGYTPVITDLCKLLKHAHEIAPAAMDQAELYLRLLNQQMTNAMHDRHLYDQAADEMRAHQTLDRSEHRALDARCILELPGLFPKYRSHILAIMKAEHDRPTRDYRAISAHIRDEIRHRLPHLTALGERLDQVARIKIGDKPMGLGISGRAYDRAREPIYDDSAHNKIQTILLDLKPQPVRARGRSVLDMEFFMGPH
jgi:hypothetical protein